MASYWEVLSYLDITVNISTFTLLCCCFNNGIPFYKISPVSSLSRFTCNSRLSIIVTNLNPSRYRRDVVTYLAVGSSVSLTGFEIWSFCWKRCRSLSIHTYLRLQVLKVGIVYLLLDIVVLSEGGFRLEIGGWVSSLIAVFVMSIPLGYIHHLLFGPLRSLEFSDEC
jgi:hypothetical protein